MPVDIRHYKSQYHPLDDTSQVGGAVTATEITGTVPNEVVPAGGLVSGASEKMLYYKTFIKNAGVDTATQVKLYILNAIDAMGAAGKILLTAGTLDAGKTARIVGLVGSAVSLEVVTLQAGDVVSSGTYDQCIRVELTGAAAASADITIKRYEDGTILGKIPASYFTATSEVDIGLEGTLNGTGTSPNRLTAPTGITFSRPNSSAEALAIPDLAGGAAQGVWRRYRLYANVTSTPRLDLVFQVAWVSP